jgi:protein-S-isoprenylcysteine O-methyltransferase Ste14
MVKWIVFGVVSAGIVFLSWPSLGNPRSHGFWRFFAFECIVLLVLDNAGQWFANPFSARQIVSWCLLTASAALAVHGFAVLARIGRPSGSVENTSVVVRQGAYRFIRHPLYASLLLFAWGVFLKGPSPMAGSLAVATTVFLTLTARVEEVENLGRFGADYAAYMETTRMFIPFLF